MSNLGREDLEDMECRTRPLGPWQENAERPQEFDGTRPDTDKGFPVADYHIPVPDLDSVTDAIRLEKLSFVLVSDGKNETLNNPDKDSQQTSNRKYRDGAGRSSPHGRRPQASTTEKRGTSHSKGGTSSKDALVGPSTFDSSITFAIGGDSCPVMLRYDVDFVFAYPCRDGPHRES